MCVGSKKESSTESSREISRKHPQRAKTAQGMESDGEGRGGGRIKTERTQASQERKEEEKGGRRRADDDVLRGRTTQNRGVSNDESKQEEG
eukprot:107559-Rhodomonas_salina.5